jgi:uncharacterized protein DUF6573
MNDTLIYTYTRAQALADGVLIDVSETARELGFRYPVALTAALWADIQAIPVGSTEDVAGRLWDVLWMAACAARWGADGADQLTYELIMAVEGAQRACYPVKIVIGPGDAGEPVLTLMRPNED